MTATDTAWPDVNFNYAGAHVLVTGGTSGIGLSIAHAYRTAGARVTITGRKGDAAGYGEDLSGFAYLQLDATDDAALDRVAAHIEAVDILINNGGIAWAGGDFGQHEYEPDIFGLAVKMHLLGPYRLANALQPKLSASRLPGGASVVAIVSEASFFGVETVPGYGAAKAGMVQLTKTLSIHWAARNIRVNSVAAGLTESGMTSWIMDNKEFLAPTLARTPLNRIGQPKDIAGAVLFITSSAAGFITGQTVAVDGGYSIFG